MRKGRHFGASYSLQSTIPEPSLCAPDGSGEKVRDARAERMPDTGTFGALLSRRVVFLTFLTEMLAWSKDVLMSAKEGAELSPVTCFLLDMGS